MQPDSRLRRSRHLVVSVAWPNDGGDVRLIALLNRWWSQNADDAVALKAQVVS